MSEIAKTGAFDTIRREDTEGEHWLGRDLMPLMEYTQWRRFGEVIERAKESLAMVQGRESADLAFVQVSQVADGGNLGSQIRVDYRLSRFGAYLVAMAGDDTKAAVAHARVYFAVRTREAEVAPVTPQVPQSFASALLLAAELEMARAKEAARAELAEASVAVLVPAADAWYGMAAPGQAYDFTRSAMHLSHGGIEIGRNRLFNLLGSQEYKWIRRSGPDARWIPYQDQIDNHRMTIRMNEPVTNPATGELVAVGPSCMITLKGLQEIYRREGGTGTLYINEIEG